MAGGRPPFYQTVEELQERINEYWDYIKGDLEHPDPKQRRWPEHPTITGLALYLGFTSRQAILNYQEKEEFVDAIKEAKLRVEAAYEQALFGKNAAGPIFALKNFNWTDKQEIDQKTEHSGSVSFGGIQIVNPEVSLSDIIKAQNANVRGEEDSNIPA